MKCLSLLTAVIILFSTTAWGKVLEKIYAVVNGEIITLTEINTYRSNLKKGGFVNDLLFGDPAEKDKAIKSRDYLIKKLIDEKIMDYEVKKNGFVANDERVTKEISSIAKSRGASVNQMKEVLTSRGINFDEYQSFIRKSLERRQLVEKEISSKIKVSEQDVEAYFASKKGGAAGQTFAFDLAHVLLPGDKKALAQEVAKKAKNGTPFAELVSQYSVDTDGKDSGGAFGTFRSGEMLASVENSIKNLEAGETSNVVETPMGFHIFKVTEKKITSSASLEREKPQIQQFLFAKAFKEQLEFWLSQKRKDAIVQINKS